MYFVPYSQIRDRKRAAARRREGEVAPQADVLVVHQLAICIIVIIATLVGSRTTRVDLQVSKGAVQRLALNRVSSRFERFTVGTRVVEFKSLDRYCTLVVSTIWWVVWVCVGERTELPSGRCARTPAISLPFHSHPLATHCHICRARGRWVVVRV